MLRNVNLFYVKYYYLVVHGMCIPIICYTTKKFRIFSMMIIVNIIPISLNFLGKKRLCNAIPNS